MKIKTDDKVVVVAGKNKGKTGTVLKSLSSKNQVVVEKVNIRTKHIKKTTNNAGEIVHFEAPLDASNVMVICPSCSKRTRVGYLVPKKGKKSRICKKCEATLDVTFNKKRSK